MISEHSDFSDYRKEVINEADQQAFDKINEINQAIKHEVKKVKSPYLLNARYYVPNVKFYSSKVPRKLYWMEINKVRSLRLLFSRIGTATMATATTAVNVRRIAIVASIVLALLLLMGITALVVIRGLNTPIKPGEPTIEVDVEEGDITLTIFVDDAAIETDGIVRVTNYNLGKINYDLIDERVLITNSSESSRLFILMYAEIVAEDNNLNTDELYVALENVDSKFVFNKENRGVLYTPNNINVGVAFDAFRGLGICLYSGADPNRWAQKTVHILIHFRAYTDLGELQTDMQSLTSAIYSVNNLDIDGEPISDANPAVRSKLN